LIELHRLEREELEALIEEVRRFENLSEQLRAAVSAAIVEDFQDRADIERRKPRWRAGGKSHVEVREKAFERFGFEHLGRVVVQQSGLRKGVALLGGEAQADRDLGSECGHPARVGVFFSASRVARVGFR
jgi:Arc/MetJ-type ribon-helix-helix transcriptional regulator